MENINFSTRKLIGLILIIVCTLFLATYNYMEQPLGLYRHLPERWHSARNITDKSSVPLLSQINTSPITSEAGIQQDFISEEVALQFPPCTDYKSASDANRSTISFIGIQTINIGDQILVSIILYDGYGRRKTGGGDHLRPRMFKDNQKAYVAGYVIDNVNGSYTAVFEALWSGTSSITVTLAYTRETITSLYSMRQNFSSTRTIIALFTNGKYKEETICHPVFAALKKYPEVCNLTVDNSGMSWYCVKPRDINLLCEDWTHVKTSKHNPKPPVTSDESILLTRVHMVIPKTLKITVKGTRGDKTEMMSQPLLPCHQYNYTLLWTRRETTGFYFNNKWNLRHCQAVKLTEILGCLKNRTLLLFGDSTTRQWYLDVLHRFSCKPTSERWTKKQWHKRTSCINKQIQFKAEWLPHSQPFRVGFTADVIRYTHYSISRHIDEIKPNTRVIVLIHMYAHLVAYRHDVFRARIKIIRKSVENLLNRNKYALVMIKGPHTYEENTRVLCDYYSYLYRDIWFQEFEGIHDRVIYLDNKDATNALKVVPLHPPDNVVSDMVNQMLAYVC